MIEVTPNLSIDENEIHYEFVRSSGPGGQNVNKVATAVQLRFDVKRSNSLPEDIRVRLQHLAGSKINTEGQLIIDARQYRTQEQNRVEALNRLLELIRRAAEKPKIRRKSKPSSAVRKRRLESKRQRGEIKRLRHWQSEDDL